MKMFEPVRVVPQDPTFQFHFELTKREMQNLQRELATYSLPGTTHYVIQHLVNGHDANKKHQN